MFITEQQYIYESIDRLFAYDTGAVDSGIKNKYLRDKIIEYLYNLSNDELRIFLSDFIRKRFVSPEAIAEGYGIDDVKIFIEWLDEYMNYTI